MKFVEILQQLGQLVIGLGQLLWAVFLLLLPWWPLILWIAWWLLAVDWRRLRGVLRQGAWAPLVLLMLIVALVWSRLDPAALSWGFFTMPSFWWQLVAVISFAGLTALLGVIQDVLQWGPPEVNLEPPAEAAAEHGHH